MASEREKIRLSFLHALRRQSADVVHVQPDQLATAIGFAAAQRLCGQGIDLPALARQQQRRRDKILEPLIKRQRELRTLLSAGIPDSRRELAALQQKLAKIQAGALNVVSLVTVSVAGLRAALEQAEETTTTTAEKTLDNDDLHSETPRDPETDHVRAEFLDRSVPEDQGDPRA